MTSKGSAEDKPLVVAARGNKPTRLPVWFMRQAGRYLPEYRAIRSGLSFTDLCQNPKLAAEVTLQPLQRYDVDAAIIFSDILIPAMGMGQDLTFGKGHGPQLSQPIRDAKSLGLLKRAHPEKDLGYVGDAISTTKKGLNSRQALIGFAGAPFTVASYMIEGGGSKTFTEVKRLLFNDRATFDALHELICEVTIDYLDMQVKAGADVLMLFDSWAGQLTPMDYQEAVFPVTAKVIEAVRKKTGVPIIYYPGQGSDRLPELGGLQADVLSIDWRVRLSHAQRLIAAAGLEVTLQGNLDPQVLIGNEDFVRQRTRDVLKDAASAPAHIFNVGHGLMPHIPPESLTWVIDELRQ